MSTGDGEEWILRVRRTGDGTVRELFEALTRDGVVPGGGGFNVCTPRAIRIQVRGSPQIARRVLTAHAWTLESVQPVDNLEPTASATRRRGPGAWIAAYLGAAVVLGVAARRTNGWVRLPLATLAAASAVTGAWITLFLGVVRAPLWPGVLPPELCSATV